MTRTDAQPTAGRSPGGEDRTPRTSSTTHSSDGTNPLAYSAAELAARLGVSLRHVRRLDSAGKLPEPVRLGRAVRWRAHEISAWLAAGAPERRRWRALRDRQEGGRQ